MRRRVTSVAHVGAVPADRTPMTVQTHSRAARLRWACVCGTLAIVATYVGFVAHLGLPAIPGHVGVALVAVLTWAAVREAEERQVVASSPADARRGAAVVTGRF